MDNPVLLPILSKAQKENKHPMNDGKLAFRVEGTSGCQELNPCCISVGFRCQILLCCIENPSLKGHITPGPYIRCRGDAVRQKTFFPCMLSTSARERHGPSTHTVIVPVPGIHIAFPKKCCSDVIEHNFHTPPWYVPFDCPQTLSGILCQNVFSAENCVFHKIKIFQRTMLIFCQNIFSVSSGKSKCNYFISGQVAINLHSPELPRCILGDVVHRGRPAHVENGGMRHHISSGEWSLMLNFQLE